jgi:hypothetical protein
MASLILHELNGTRTKLAHLTEEEMNGILASHEYSGHGHNALFRAKSDILNRYVPPGTKISCIRDTPQDGIGIRNDGGRAEIWEHIDGKFTLTEEYRWECDDQPAYPHWCLP